MWFYIYLVIAFAPLVAVAVLHLYTLEQIRKTRIRLREEEDHGTSV